MRQRTYSAGTKISKRNQVCCPGSSLANAKTNSSELRLPPVLSWAQESLGVYALPDSPVLSLPELSS
jgi:hypothetical protein